MSKVPLMMLFRTLEKTGQHVNGGKFRKQGARESGTLFFDYLQPRRQAFRLDFLPLAHFARQALIRAGVPLLARAFSGEAFATLQPRRQAVRFPAAPFFTVAAATREPFSTCDADAVGFQSRTACLAFGGGAFCYW